MTERTRPSRRRRIAIWATVAAVAVLGPATAGTAWALDRFVIPHVEISDVDAYEAAQSTETDAASGTDDASTDDGSGTAGTATLTDTSYTSDAASVSISTVVTGSGDATVTTYVADVTLSDATVLQSAFAANQFGENITETTSQIAADNGAVFAINGDYYGFRDTGIVIRNGVVYRDEGAR